MSHPRGYRSNSPDDSVRTLQPADHHAALRWAGATDAAPFASVRAAPEKTAPWDRRKPYAPADVERLLAVTTGQDRVLVLLGAHAGLRVSEALALRHADVRLSDGELDVRDGKGGRARTVPVSESLARALREVAHTDSQDSREEGRAEGGCSACATTARRGCGCAA